MKTTYKMKEATNKEEAIISILDVIEENPLWINKVTDGLFILIKDERFDEEARQFFLNQALEESVIDLFVKLKTEYYHFKDFTQWNY